MDKTEQAYRSAEGCCIFALVVLRRLSGKEAIEELQRAIRTIEDEQRRSQRESRIAVRCTVAARPLSSEPIEF